MMNSQAMGQQPFVFYSADVKADARQQHYIQQHRMQQLHMLPNIAALPPTPIYSRPNSACSQPQMPPTLYSNAPSLTPMTSPQPHDMKAPMMLEASYSEADIYYPSTPPLSNSGSVVGSPNSCEMLQTPMNPMFSGLESFHGLKENFESIDNLALDWTHDRPSTVTACK
jgi:hypothetical protein